MKVEFFSKGTKRTLGIGLVLMVLWRGLKRLLSIALGVIAIYLVIQIAKSAMDEDYTLFDKFYETIGYESPIDKENDEITQEWQRIQENGYEVGVR